MIWSVVMLSSTTIKAFPSTVSASGFASGNGLIFGPLITSTFSPSGAGGTTALSLIRKSFGISISGSSTLPRGFVNTPLTAEIAAVSGLKRYTSALTVPDLPLKLRLKVLSDTPSVHGACPIPMHGPQPHSRILAPAFRRSASAPFSASMVKTCLEPGAMTSCIFSATVCPFKIAATFIKSSHEEFVQLPIAT